MCARPVQSFPTKSQLYGRQWRYARANYLARNPYCVMCQREGKVAAAKHVDHIEKHHGNLQLFWDEDNWQGLCEHHHNSVKQAEEKSGRLIGVDRNGRPTHPNHPWNK